MGATISDAFLLHAVTDDLAMTMRANGRQRLNSAFKRIKGVGLARHRYVERLVIIVSAGCTFSHGTVLSLLIFLLVGFDFLVAVGDQLRFSFQPILQITSVFSATTFVDQAGATGDFLVGGLWQAFLFHRHTIFSLRLL